jgi:capsular polysaccharide export protein
MWCKQPLGDGTRAAKTRAGYPRQNPPPHSNFTQLAMAPKPDTPKHFLLLQGPHGPFFGQLADILGAAGAKVWRVGFNRGDQMFWRRPNFIAYTAPPHDWAATCASLIDTHQITDLVLYGDSRPIHAQAIALARQRGLRIHVFEEGYLRPFWVTYERGGSNGNSRLMTLGLDQMRMALSGALPVHRSAPATWGDMREHVFYGALYHFFVLAMNRGYRNFKPHREISVVEEFRLYLRRFILMPWHRVERKWATRRIMRGGFPFHLVLLQLEHDASFRAHSDFESMVEFVDLCLVGFAEGALPHHHLVFKAHPLENGRLGLRRLVMDRARDLGLGQRVHFVHGGKLAQLLNATNSAITVNSTAGQQALWRSLPLRVFGRAVYDKPELVSRQPIAEFFATPQSPDSRAYRLYRHFLLETSQVPGGFYAARSRKHLLRHVADMILSEADPYDALLGGTAAPRQQLVDSV